MCQKLVVSYLRPSWTSWKMQQVRCRLHHSCSPALPACVSEPGGTVEEQPSLVTQIINRPPRCTETRFSPGSDNMRMVAFTAFLRSMTKCGAATRPKRLRMRILMSSGGFQCRFWWFTPDFADAFHFRLSRILQKAAPLPAGISVQGGCSPLHGFGQRVVPSVLTSRL